MPGRDGTFPLPCDAGETKYVALSNVELRSRARVTVRIFPTEVSAWLKSGEIGAADPQSLRRRSGESARSHAAEIFRRGSRWRGPHAERLACVSSARESVGPRSDPAPLETTVGIAVEPENFRELRGPRMDRPALRMCRPTRMRKNSSSIFRASVRTRYFDDAPAGRPGRHRAISSGNSARAFSRSNSSVTNVDRATEILRERFAIGADLSGDAAGADGTRVNFFLVPRPVAEGIDRAVESAKS